MCSPLPVPTALLKAGFGREPLVLDNGVVNMEFAVSYRGGAWSSVSIDVARSEALPIVDAHAGLVHVRQFMDRILSSTN
jgi:hypothetical protein